MKEITISKASKSDYQQIIELLENSNLPVKGVKEILNNTFVAKNKDKIIGCAALELYNSTALLRSVAVNKLYQGKGIGLQLTMKSIDLAKSKSIKEIYLLTETAENYFTKLGFNKITRSEASKEIQNSEEFSAICPKSAIVLKLEIK